MATVGATVTGIYAACASIVGFANPLLFGYYNVLTPKFVRILKAEGGAGLRRQAVRDAFVLAAIMTAFCAIVFIVGDEVMRFLYRGASFSGNGDIIAVLAVAALIAAVGVPASIALAAAQQARPVAAAMFVTAALNLVLVWVLLPRWGLLGAAYGILVAEVVGSLGRWLAFLALVPATKGPHRQTAAFNVAGAGER
jgi:O-antigen/teichoic acid export membrane protein